jgi:alpha-tubulin suppressor-like RCC1 family protein
MAGSESSYFLFVDGTVASCGRNDEGQLGDGTFIDQVKTFVIIPNNDIIEKLGSGPSSQSVFFIGENDLVYGAGANDRFQLGLGAPGKIAFPNLVAFDDPVFDVLKISSSGTHTVAINELICTNFPTATPTVTPTAYPTLSPTVPESKSDLLHHRSSCAVLY